MADELHYSTVIFKPFDNDKSTGTGMFFSFLFFLSFFLFGDGKETQELTIMLPQHLLCLECFKSVFNE